MPSQREEKISAFFIARLLGEIGFIIAVPLVVLVLAGRWLDTRFGFKAMFLLLGLITALFASSWVIYKKIQKISH